MKEFITNVTGVSYYQDNVSRFACEAIGSYTLDREPNNAFDKFAIAVTIGEYKLGYIPKSISERIAKEIDSGKHYTASFNKRMDNWSGPIGFQIKIKEEE